MIRLPSLVAALGVIMRFAHTPNNFRTEWVSICTWLFGCASSVCTFIMLIKVIWAAVATIPVSCEYCAWPLLSFSGHPVILLHTQIEWKRHTDCEESPEKLRPNTNSSHANWKKQWIDGQKTGQKLLPSISGCEVKIDIRIFNSPSTDATTCKLIPSDIHASFSHEPCVCECKPCIFDGV